MRRQFIAVAILLTAASAASADTLAVFVSNVEYQTSHLTTSDNGTAANHDISEWSGGIGLQWDHAWNVRWSTDASVMWDRRHTVGTRFENSVPVTTREAVDTYPVDVMMRYHFLNDSRWTPYLSAGAHYVNGPGNELASTPLPAGMTLQHFGSRLSAQVGVGTKFRITPRLGLQFDLKRQLRHDGVFYDPLTRGSFGVNWKF